VRKRLRQSGLDYVNTRNVLVPEKELPQCSCHCKRRCSLKVSDEVRLGIFQHFKAMCDRNRQAAFIAGHVVSVPKKQTKSQPQSHVATKKTVQRNKSFQYFLTVPDHGRVQVCKTFFFSTLPVDRKTVERVAQTSFGGVATVDRRGKKPSNKKSDDVRERVRAHIRSFPAIDSHYCRFTSTKTYLGSNLSIRKMYSLYCDKCVEDGVVPENEKYYRDVFNTEFNISFNKPKKDECNYCTTYRNSSAVEKNKCRLIMIVTKTGRNVCELLKQNTRI
jgi:hypothetical protein